MLEAGARRRRGRARRRPTCRAGRRSTARRPGRPAAARPRAAQRVRCGAGRAGTGRRTGRSISRSAAPVSRSTVSDEVEAALPQPGDALERAWPARRGRRRRDGARWNASTARGTIVAPAVANDARRSWPRRSSDSSASAASAASSSARTSSACSTSSAPASVRTTPRARRSSSAHPGLALERGDLLRDGRRRVGQRLGRTGQRPAARDLAQHPQPADVEHLPDIRAARRVSVQGRRRELSRSHPSAEP